VSSLLAKLGKNSRRELAEAGVSTDPVVPAQGRLPEPLDTFVGRSDDLDDIAQLVCSHRLVTLVGPPGVGKTRLAVEAARRVAGRYDGNVRFVELAPVGEEADVGDRLLVTVGCPQTPGQDALATLTAQARDEPLLVLIDNCEHVLAATTEIVQALISSWPRTAVLATSREPLRVAGELVRPVEPLTVPDVSADDPAAVLAAESVHLLVDRALASGAGLSVTAANAAAVAALCRRLDGLPLAVELVAGRLRTLTPGQLAERPETLLSLLADTGPGKEGRTVRAAIERSYAGLTAAERDLFTALAVFPGAFTLEEVETICAEPVPGPTVVETFSALVDRSLVSVVPSGSENRYRLLDTLHAFAEEMIPAERDDQLRRRHVSYFVDLVELAEPRLHGPHAQDWLRRIAAEQDNLTQALEWSLAHDPVCALRLVAAMWQFWQDTDQRRSGMQWAERALAVETPAPVEIRLNALLAAATLLAPWDAPRCAELTGRAAALARQLDDPQWWARTRLAAVMSTAYAADPTADERARAREAARDALGYFRAVGDHWRAAEVLTASSLLQPEQDAIVTLAQARRQYELEGDQLRAANCAYMTAAMLVRDLDDPRSAEKLARQAIDMAAAVGSEHETAHARSILAEVHLHDGATEVATELAADCLGVFRRAADHRCVSAMLLLLGQAAAQRGDEKAARKHLHEALDVARLGAHARTVPLIRAQLATLSG
jgi:predicted ATPase